jgi:hypothetical protein
MYLMEDLYVQSRAIVGFSVDDHQIRGLMRFIEMTSRESKNEDDVHVTGAPITKDGWT